MSNIFQVLSEEDLSYILNNSQGQLIVINFSAKWCGPCQMMKPHFVDFAKKYSTVIFLTIDVVEENEKGYKDIKYKFLNTVRSLPTYMAYYNVKRVTGFTLEEANPSTLEARIKTALRDIVGQEKKAESRHPIPTYQPPVSKTDFVPYEGGSFAPLEGEALLGHQSDSMRAREDPMRAREDPMRAREDPMRAREDPNIGHYNPDKRVNLSIPYDKREYTIQEDGPLTKLVPRGRTQQDSYRGK